MTWWFKAFLLLGLCVTVYDFFVWLKRRRKPSLPVADSQLPSPKLSSLSQTQIGLLSDLMRDRFAGFVSGQLYGPIKLAERRFSFRENIAQTLPKVTEV